MLELLVAYGADVHEERVDGRTTIDLAAVAGVGGRDRDRVEERGKAANRLLVKDGAQVNHRDKVGIAPLEYALGDPAYLYAEAQLDNGADPKARNAEGATLLAQLAAPSTPPGRSEPRRMKLAERLLPAGVDVRAKDTKGNTALHVATEPAAALWLIEQGADVNAENQAGETPLSAAPANPDRRTASVLLGHGAQGGRRELALQQQIAEQWRRQLPRGSAWPHRADTGDGDALGRRGRLRVMPGAHDGDNGRAIILI